MPTPTTEPDADSLAMQIYSALLGDRPRIRKPKPNDRPRVRMSVRLEIEHNALSPFRQTSMRDHLERCVGYAARAIDDARARLATSRPSKMATVQSDEATEKAKPVILIGAAARRRKPASAHAA